MELDIKLQTLMLTCSRLITELHEIIRKERDILVKFSSIVVKLEEVDTIVGNNSATPSQSDPDDVILSKLVALRGDINACEKMIQQFLADYRFAFELPLATLKKRIDASWDRRSSKIKDLQIQNLESAVRLGIFGYREYISDYNLHRILGTMWNLSGKPEGNCSNVWTPIMYFVLRCNPWCWKWDAVSILQTTLTVSSETLLRDDALL